MKKLFLFASVSVASGILFLSLYDSLINARSWGSDIPNSIAAAREYFKVINPGNFFRIFSPLNQVLGLLAIILFWKSSPAIRLYLGLAFALYVSADVLTFAYFYPRNAILFKNAAVTDVALLKKTWAEWNSMNWLRVFIVLAGLFFSWLALHKINLLNRKSTL